MPSKEQKSSTSFMRGRKAARDGVSKAKNPFDPGYFHNQWNRGHDQMTKELARRAQSKGKHKWL